MSAFIVNDEVIHNILSYLKEDWDDNYYLRNYVLKGYGVETDQGLEILGQEFLDLNVEAVNQRYNELNPRKIYKFKYVNVNIFQAYKSAKCLRYQYSEGEVPETPLYKILDEYIQTCAERIVDNLPQYEKAIW